MKLLLVNQFGPESDAPTARVLEALAAGLVTAGHKVEIVDCGTDYQGSTRGIGRIFSELRAVGKLAAELVFSRKADRWIVLSSPPGLLVAAAAAALVRKVEIYHWVMDLYPDVAVAAGMLESGGKPDRLARKAMGWALSRCREVFVLDEAMRGCVAEYGVEAKLLELWPLEKIASGLGEIVPERVWLYSGNLGRAHDWKSLLQVQKLLEEHGSDLRLRFQARGAEIESAKEEASTLGLKNVEWLPLQPREKLGASLHRAGALIVTQREEFAGCVWPSKLALASRIPRPLLWIGPTEQPRLAGRPATGSFRAEEIEAIAKWLCEWCGVPIPEADWADWMHLEGRLDRLKIAVQFFSEESASD